jgi:type II secretory pathway pseudopilin PulG
MELVIVVLIIGILGAVAVPRFTDSLCRFRVAAAAKRIVADLMLARQHAKSSEKAQVVEFSLPANFYELQGYMDPDHPSLEYKIDLSKTGHPAELVACDFAGNRFVTFDMHGRPDNGGSVVVQSGNHQKTIIVNGLTGKAAVQ